MVSRHLIVKLYLWLLLALTLSALAVGSMFALLSPHTFEERAREFVRDEMSALRDMTERLLNSGLPLDVQSEVLSPLGDPHLGALAVLRRDGTALLSASGRGADDTDVVALSAAERERVLAEGMLMRWQGRGRTVLALPIRLPDGERGVFVVAFHREFWRGHGVPWRLLAGLAAVLVVLWLLSWPLAAHLARPLQRMARAADALGQGDLAVRIAPRDIQRHGRHPRRDEIGRLAQSFNRMAENVQRLLLGHKRLLGDISHELRTPLARLRLALELARDSDAAEQGPYLDSIARQVDDMEALIAELLLFTRLEEDPSALRPEALDARGLAERVLAAQRPEADAKSVTLALAVDPAVPTLRADPRLLERALANALRNAIAYSPAGGTVRVAVDAQATAAGRVTFTVQDEGPGVPDALREQIFDPFVRAEAHRSRDAGGVGLGLSIVRRCMAAHGGGAHAAAGDGGRGLALTLWLPLSGGA